MKLKLLIIWFLNLFDYTMTLKQVNKYGIDIEANPIMRLAMCNEGLFFVVKVLLVTLWLYILYLNQDNTICKLGSWVLLAVYGILAGYHVYLNFLNI